MEWNDILSPWNGGHRSALREDNEDQILGVEPINELYPQRALTPSVLVFISVGNSVPVCCLRSRIAKTIYNRKY